ncbi:MAG: hypothetical protein PHD67_01740 [Oscillospiraceae bacterium]|nr:hypothetical protein [Oscillospiraceae bacterium]
MLNVAKKIFPKLLPYVLPHRAPPAEGGKDLPFCQTAAFAEIKAHSRFAVIVA